MIFSKVSLIGVVFFSLSIFSDMFSEIKTVQTREEIPGLGNEASASFCRKFLIVNRVKRAK
jgi:hypothetical protein